MRRHVWLAPGLVLSPGLPQGRNPLRRQRHPPRPARGDLQAVEFARLAPIGDRVDRHIEEGGRRLGTLAPSATLAVGRSRRPQRTATRDAISIAEPLHLTCRKRPTLPAVIARVIETRCDVEVGMVWGQLPHALDHLRVRTTDHVCPLGARHFHSTTGVGLPAHRKPYGRLELGECDVLEQEAHTCLRSAWVVVSACHTAGRSYAKATIRWRSASLTWLAASGGTVVYSRSSWSTTVNFSCQSCSRLRATQRFSGSYVLKHIRALMWRSELCGVEAGNPLCHKLTERIDAT